MSDLGWASVTPKPCRRHAWGPHKGWGRLTALGIAEGWSEVAQECVRCGKPKDATTSRRARNNRSRGNAIERDWCHRLNLRLTGKYGDTADGVNALFIGQCKSRATGAFPGWLADELAKLASLRSGKTPILGIVEAPSPGKRARRLVMIEGRDWIALHVGVEL